MEFQSVMPILRSICYSLMKVYCNWLTQRIFLVYLRPLNTCRQEKTSVVASISLALQIYLHLPKIVQLFNEQYYLSRLDHEMGAVLQEFQEMLLEILFLPHCW